MKKVGFIDIVHPVLQNSLSSLGFVCVNLTALSKIEISEILHEFTGLVVRSRFPLDSSFLLAGKNLEFIARSGAGLENIDIDYCNQKSIALFNAPEGNSNAVAEHGMGMLLSLFNNLYKGQSEICNGQWNREGNRGVELDGKTIGLIGYGNNGSVFARKLRGFETKVLAYDKYKKGFGDEFVQEVEMIDIFEKVDILSLHIPQTNDTKYLVDLDFISQFRKPFYLINMSRGKIVKTSDLVNSIVSGKVLGACLDVLEYEKTSFEDMFTEKESMNSDFKYLINSNKVVLSPHVAGWTVESYYKLSLVMLEKIKSHYNL